MRFKQYFAGFLSCAFLFGSVTAFAENKNIEAAFNNIKITLNGKEIKTDVEPLQYSGRTYVPARLIAESLGANVNWNEETNTVEINTQQVENLDISPQEIDCSQGVSKISISGIEVKINKIVREGNYLKVYIKYVNNSKSKVRFNYNLPRIYSGNNELYADLKNNMAQNYADHFLGLITTDLYPGQYANDSIYFSAFSTDVINSIKTVDFKLDLNKTTILFKNINID